MKCATIAKKCLFGGTILAAGLITQAANAQAQFVNGQTLAYANVWDGYANATFFGTGPFSIVGFDQPGYAFAYAYGNASIIGGLGYTVVPTYWGQAVEWYSDFTVTQNGTITAAWDFTGDTYGLAGFYASALIVTDLTNSVVLFQTLWDGGWNGSQVAGSVQIPVQAGVQYSVEPFALGWSGLSWAHITIPGPATASLLAVAGLIGARRRR